MPRKRTSLDALFHAPPAPEPVAPTEPPATPRRPVKQQTVYLPLPVYEQLRTLAFQERAKMHSLLMEGLDRVFKDRGLPSIGDLAGTVPTPVIR